MSLLSALLFFLLGRAMDNSPKEILVWVIYTLRPKSLRSLGMIIAATGTGSMNLPWAQLRRSIGRRVCFSSLIKHFLASRYLSPD
jgi:hypothetical protein